MLQSISNTYILIISYSIYTLFITSLSTFFIFNDTATTEIYSLSLHDALPISPRPKNERLMFLARLQEALYRRHRQGARHRSEEHTSELQSRRDLVCRLLLEKKKRTKILKNHTETHRRDTQTLL